MSGQGKRVSELPKELQGFFAPQGGVKEPNEPVYSKFTPSFTFDYMMFERILEHGWYKDLEALRKYLKAAVGYYWDMNVFRFSDIYGHEYSFGVCLGAGKQLGKDTVTIFSATGSHNLGTFLIEPGVTKKLLKIAEKYTEGFCACSLCGEMIKKVDIAGSYFGGCYCVSCWETGYQGHESMKAVEARESYN
jgi:hypothetical protein